jgi:hypothetical protein
MVFNYLLKCVLFFPQQCAGLSTSLPYAGCIKSCQGYLTPSLGAAQFTRICGWPGAHLLVTVCGSLQVIPCPDMFWRVHLLI